MGALYLENLLTQDAFPPTGGTLRCCWPGGHLSFDNAQLFREVNTPNQTLEKGGTTHRRAEPGRAGFAVSERELDAFSRTVSHDLRRALAGMRGFLGC